MNKKLKILIRISTIILSIVVILIGAAHFTMHGWKLFGFKYCQHPKIAIHDVKVTDYTVEIMATGPTPSLGFKGETKYVIEGTTVKIGIGSLTLLDIIVDSIFHDRNIVNPIGDYMTIAKFPEPTEIDKVILCGGGDERVIWTREEGNIN